MIHRKSRSTGIFLAVITTLTTITTVDARGGGGGHHGDSVSSRKRSSSPSGSRARGGGFGGGKSLGSARRLGSKPSLSAPLRRTVSTRTRSAGVTRSRTVNTHRKTGFTAPTARHATTSASIRRAGVRHAVVRHGGGRQVNDWYGWHCRHSARWGWGNFSFAPVLFWGYPDDYYVAWTFGRYGFLYPRPFVSLYFNRNSDGNVSGPKKERNLTPLDLFDMIKEGRDDLVANMVKECPDFCAVIMRNDLMSPVHWALKYKRFDIACTLAQQKNTNINAKNKKGLTALHMACQLGAVKVVKALVKAGANLDLQDNSGNTPLHTALTNGQNECAEALVKGHAATSIPNNNKQTARALAERKKAQGILELMNNTQEISAAKAFTDLD